MIMFIIIIILFFVIIGIASSSRKQTSILEDQQRILSEEKKTAALATASRRECPKCAEFISRKAVLCHYCKHTIEPQYVDDHAANKQIIKIMGLRQSGLKESEIASKLNEAGELFLEDGSIWCEDKVSSILKSFS